MLPIFSTRLFPVFGFILLTSVLKAQVSGTVFRDYNANGSQGTAAPNVESGVAGVIVNAYDAANVLIASFASAANGAYSIPAAGSAFNGTQGSNTGFVGAGVAVRLEFLMPSGAGNCGFNGGVDFVSSGNAAATAPVKFVSGGASNVHFAIHNPAEYVSTNDPDLFVPCYVAGNPLAASGTATTGDAFIKVKYASSGTSPSPTKLLSAAAIGSTYGVAYSRQAKKVFTSAFFKRHVGLGTLGSGGIYLFDPNAAAPIAVTHFYDLDANGFATRCASGCVAYGSGTSFSITGANPNQTVAFIGNGEGVIGTPTDRDLSGTASDPSFDAAAFGQVGKLSLGDLEISDDGKYLFVTNLFDNKLYRLTLNDAKNPTSVTAVSSWTLPNPPLRSTLGGGFATTYAGDDADFYDGTLGKHRPFALKFYEGKLYVGAVTTGENGGTSTIDNNTGNPEYTDIWAYAWEATAPTAGFAFSAVPVLQFPLNFNRGTQGDGHNESFTPWSNTFPIPFFSDASAEYMAQAQAWLADIEFDADGSMILGFRDRFGDMIGFENASLTDKSTAYTGIGNGDIFRAYPNAACSAFTIEKNGDKDGPGPFATVAGQRNGQGPGGGEFYYRDNISVDHLNNGMGGLAILAGTNEVVNVHMDPTAYYTGGLRYYHNGTGVTNKSYRIYAATDASLFGKANGLGDLELLTGQAPIEIGNRVWNDMDKDGIQDASEPGLANVALELWTDPNGDGNIADGVKVGETTTSASGLFYFDASNVNLNGATSLLSQTDYVLRVGAADWTGGAGIAELANLQLTTANNDGSANGDRRDSDGQLMGNVPQISVRTGDFGENDPSLAFGFQAAAVAAACSGHAVAAFDLGGVNAPNAAVGTLDGFGADMHEAGDALLLDLGNYLDAGSTVTLTWRTVWIVPLMEVLVSDGIAPLVQVSGSPFSVTSGAFTTQAFTVPVVTRYVRLNSLNNDDLVLDAVSYNSTCSQCDLAIDKTTVSGCYQSGGQSKATVSVEVSWAYVPPGGTITVKLGSQTRTITPGPITVNYGYQVGNKNQTIVSPQVVAFEIDADGTAGQPIEAFTGAAFSTSICKDSKTINAPAACPPIICAGGQLGGTVFNDFNADGIRQAGELTGLAGVTVKAVACDGTIFTATTDAAGNYALNVPAAKYPVRVEFSGLPTLFGQGTSNGADGRTTTQFVGAADCQVDLGVVDPNDYCQSDPQIVIPCYVYGDPLPMGSPSGALDALVSFDYALAGLNNAGAMEHAALAKDVGTLWGVAYNKYTKKVFSAATLKRHAGLGPLGLGGIYVSDYSDPSNPTTVPFIDVAAPSININVGSIADNNTRGLVTDPTQPSADNLGYLSVGKIGIGGLDLSADGNKMYLANIADNKVYAIDITAYNSSGTLPTSGGVSSFQMGTGIACTGGNLRIWALKQHKGKIYVGMVCDAETSQNKSNLRAYVQELDPATSVVTTVFDFPLTYPKGFPSFYDDPNITGWFAWTDDWNVKNPANLGGVAHPEPIFTGIEFDIDGSMVLSFGDRTGMQTGFANYQPNGTGSYSGVTGGDVLRAFKVGNDFILENNAKAGAATGNGPANNQGAGFGEFYNDNWTADGGTILIHAENVMGGLALLPGSGEAIVATIDPLNHPLGTSFWQYAFSGGVRHMNNASGQNTSSYIVYNSTQGNNGSGNGNGTFGKASGLGDMVLTCAAPQFLQIGNYVWLDTDKDGTQDACETPLTGVKIALYKDVAGALTYLANTTTGANGEYYFTGLGAAGENWTATSGFDSLLPSMDYKIVFGWDGTTSQLSNGFLTIGGIDYGLTDANSGEGTSPDLNDSDAAAMTVAGGSFPSISAKTGGLGSVDHTFDAGFFTCPFPPFIGADQAVCSGDTLLLVAFRSLADQSDSVRGKWLFGQGASGNQFFPASPTNDSIVHVRFENLGTSARVDTLVFENLAGCRDTALVTVHPNPYILARDTAICAGATVDLSTLFSANAVAGATTFYTTFEAAKAATPTISASQNPTQTTEFFVRKASAAGCFDIDSIDVTVTQPVSAGSATNPADICEAASGLTFVNLFAQLAGETAGGTWTKISGPNAGLNFDAGAGTFDPNGLPAGTYVFEYAVAGSVPCPSDSEQVWVTIKTCAVPCPPKVCLPVKVVKLN